MSKLFVKQSYKFLDAQARVGNDPAKRSLPHFLVIGDDDTRRGIVASNDHMAAALPPEHESDPLQGGTHLTPR